MSAGGCVWEDGQHQLFHLGVAVRADSMWGARGLLGLWQILCGLPEIRVGYCYSSDVMSMRFPAHKLDQVVGAPGFPLSGSHRDDAAVAAMPIFSWLDPCFGHSGAAHSSWCDVAWPMSTQRPPCVVSQPFRMCLGWAVAVTWMGCQGPQMGQCNPTYSTWHSWEQVLINWLTFLSKKQKWQLWSDCSMDHKPTVNQGGETNACHRTRTGGLIQGL